MKLDTLADPPVVLGLSFASALALRRRSPPDAARFAVAAPVSFAISKLVKWLVPEHRPRLAGRHLEQSMPSGHSAEGTAFSMASVAAMRRWWLVGVAGAAIAAVNIDRVRKREHWWKDVIVGDAIGLAGALAGAFAAHLVRRRMAQRSGSSR